MPRPPDRRPGSRNGPQPFRGAGSAPQVRRRLEGEQRQGGGQRRGEDQRPLRAPGPDGVLLFGTHAVSAAWLNPERRCRALYATETALEALAPTLAAAAAAGLDRPQPAVVAREALDRLTGGAVHQGLALDAKELPEIFVEDLPADADALILMLDQVTDPHNVGAILRSAAAFGAAAVVVQTRHAPPVTGVLAKAASGAVETVPLVRATNLARALDTLRDRGFATIGLAEEGAHDLGSDAGAFGGPTVIVLGSEGEGLRRLVAERCDRLVRLPTRPPIGSLNVSNAAAIALYEARRGNASAGD